MLVALLLLWWFLGTHAALRLLTVRRT
jgi:hypothetical protein